MKKLIFLFLITFFSLNELFSQQVIGGDITWTCINSGPDAGKYKFKLTLFNQCVSGSLPTSQSLTVYNNPSLSSISMSIFSEKDISPICYDTSQQVSCLGSDSAAVSMAIYYSAPVALSGIPPANGWGFTWTSNSRNITSSNLSSAGGSGYTLRSVMYNFKNINKNTCYDNSPQFLESPSIDYCTGYSFALNNYAYDPDNDQATHSWATPIGSSSTFPPATASAMTWRPGYSMTSPFPGTFFSPLNVPATLSSFSGEILFNTIVNQHDRIYYSIKVQSIRDSVVISEVYRDMMAAPKACPPTPTFPPISNTTPQVSFKRSPATAVNIPLPAVDTIFAGDTLRFYMTSIDFQFLPGFIGQTNFLYPFGSQFGLNFGSSTQGCDKPPCATLDTLNSGFNLSENRFEGQFGVDTEFEWITDSIHGSPEGNWYHFYFYVQDDWCPTPGINMQTYSVLVKDEPDNFILGEVYNDLNGNGVKDSVEGNMSDVLIRQSPPVYYTASKSNGNYKLPAFSNTYTITAIPPRYYQITDPASGIHTVTTSGSGNFYTGKDFGLQAIPNINDLSIDIHFLTFLNLRPGSNAYCYFTVKNLGTTTLSGNMELEYSNLLNFSSSTNPISSSTSNTLSWTYTNLAPLSSIFQYVTFNVDTTATLNDTVFLFATANPISGDTLPQDNKDSLMRLVSNSFDPNYKEVDPGRDLYVQEIKDQNLIYYTIHFQNTGNAPAIDVRITDNLEVTLDIESIELISSSHDYNFDVRGRELTFKFNDINLPDSASDFIGSQGFVTFRIIADSSLNVGDSITNAVNIYFDYNPPIYADVITHIVEEDSTTGVDDLASSRNLDGHVLHLYPNPAHDRLSVKLTSTIKNEQVAVKVLSITGKEVISTSGQIKNGVLNQDLQLDQLESGVYFVLISSERINISSKVIKQ